jgi:hypothetical protein
MVAQIDPKNTLIPVAAGQTAATSPTVKSQSAAPPVVTPTGITSVRGPDGKTFAPQAIAQTVNLPFDPSAPKLAMTGEQETAGNAVALSIAQGASPESVQSQWSSFVAEMNTNGTGGMDVNALVQWVLRQSYTEQTQDLEFYAQKVQFYNNLKQAIRNELTRARQEDSGLVSSGNPNNPNATPCNYDGVTFANEPALSSNGTPQVYSTNSNAISNRGELEAYIQNLEDQLNSVGDDAQLANVDLQDMLQKQQATLQLVSNISKMLYDTAMAVIRKIGS